MATKHFLQVSWEFLGSKTFRSIERLLGANAAIAYQKMLLAAAENETQAIPPHIVFSHDADSFADELSITYDIDPDASDKLIALLIRHGKLFQKDDMYYFRDAVDYMNSKTDAAIRQKKYRDKKKASGNWDNERDGEYNDYSKDSNDSHEDGDERSTNKEPTNESINEPPNKPPKESQQEETAWSYFLEDVGKYYFSSKLDVAAARDVYFRLLDQVWAGDEDEYHFANRVAEAVRRYYNEHMDNHRRDGEGEKYLKKLSNFLTEYLNNSKLPHEREAQRGINGDLLE